MTTPYDVFLRAEAVASFRVLRPSPRKLVAEYIDSLATNPFAEGDYVIKDGSDREVQIKILGRYAVAFWADHPVKEVKVIDIGCADRA